MIRVPWRTRLVGRAAEIADLDAELRRSATGEFRCVLLIGEPGVGKTRLAAEVREANRRGVVGLSARAHALGATASFSLWAEALEHHLRGLPAEEVAQLCGGHVDDLAGLLRRASAVRGSIPPRQPPRSRLLEGLAVLLGNLAARSPVVVVLDDLHLADPSSVGALHYLAGSLPRSRVLVIASARPGELAEQPVATRVLHDLEQEGVLRRLTVAPLEDAMVHELAEAVLHTPPSRALVDWLIRRSRGNPLFALGLLQELIDKGDDLSRPRLRSIPGGLAERVSAQVRGLTDEQQAILEVLAVAGGRVDLAELLQLAGRPLEEAGPVLQRLTRSRLVIEEEQGRKLTYEIAHPLMQEVIYADIGGAQRRVLHRHVGRVLLSMGRLGEAALHFARSAEVGDTEAVDVLREAFRETEDRGAFHEGLTVLGVLVELLPHGDRRWLDVAGALSWPAEWVVDHRAGGGAPAGIRALRAMDALLDGTADLGRRAAVKSRLSSFLSFGTGELDQAEEACTAALALFEEAGDRPNALLAALELAYTLGNRGDLPALEEGARRVLADAEAAGDRSATLHAVGVTGIAAFYRGRFGQAEEALRRSVALAREDGKLYRLTWSLMSLGWLLGYSGRLEEALAAFDEAKACNPSWREGNVLELQASVHWLSGDLPAAVAAMQDVLAWNPGVLDRRRGSGAIFATLAAAEMGLADQARDFLSLATSTFDREWLFCRELCVHARAVVCWREGRCDEALGHLRHAATALVAMEARPFAGVCLADLAEVAAGLGEAADAEHAVTALGELAESMDCDLHHALAGIATAWSALAARRAEAATEPARRARDLLAGGGYRLLRGRASDVLGRSLCGSDPTAALAALREAGVDFEACHATWRRDRTLEAMRELGGRGRRLAGAVLGPGAMTPREREVAGLAAQRLTAREIADQLFISERTVHGHLANVYAKAGARSKSEFARRARELGL